MLSEFNTCASEYNKFRADYPETLFELLIKSFGLSSETLIADVGCGTAIATIPFSKYGIPIIGLDPSLEMLNIAKTRAKELNLSISFLESSAEEIPLADSSVSFVNCAQAFHWFDSQKALKEFARILKPNGGLAIYWNNRDHISAPYLAKVENLISKYNPKHQLAYQAEDWTLVLTKSQLFTNIKFYTFSHGTEISIEDFIGLTRSFSYLRNVLSDKTLVIFENELREILKQASNNNNVWLPYQVKLWSANKQN